MKIVVSYKCVPSNDSINIKGDRSLDISKAVWEIGQFDLNAAEEAMKLAAAVESEVVALTANIPSVATDSKLRKSILCRGMGEQFAISDGSFAGADSLYTAKALKAGIDKIGGVDLIICGEGSGDIYAQQVGNSLGALLGWPTINAVRKMEYVDGKIKVERNICDAVETLIISLPAVISVTPDINFPRIPSFKDIMAAGKKPFTVWSPSDVSFAATAAYETESILAPEETERRKIILDSSADGAIDEFVNLIKKAL